MPQYNTPSEMPLHKIHDDLGWHRSPCAVPAKIVENQAPKARGLSDKRGRKGPRDCVADSRKRDFVLDKVSNGVCARKL